MLIAALSLLLSGCDKIGMYSEFHEPDELIVISTVGVDYADGKVTVTAETGTGLDGTPPTIFKETAGTLVEAINAIQNGFISNEAYFAQTDKILIGEDAATQIFDEIMDYIARDVSMRISADIFIVKNGTAQKLIEHTAGDDVSASDLLSAISVKSGALEIGTVYACSEVITGLMKEGKALAMAIKESPVIEISDEKEKSGILPAGAALVKDGKLYSFFPQEDTAGIMILKNELTTGLVSVPLPNGGAVLRIINITTKFETDDLEEKLKIKISSRMSVVETTGNIRLSEEAAIAMLEKRASEQLTEYVKRALVAAQAEKTEFFGIGKKIEIKNPQRFSAVKERWDEVFSDLEITIEADTTILNTYDIENSLGINGE